MAKALEKVEKEKTCGEGATWHQFLKKFRGGGTLEQKLECLSRTQTSLNVVFFFFYSVTAHEYSI